MPRPITKPVGYPHTTANNAGYLALWRLLRDFTGPRIANRAQLERALRQPEVFYILPKEWRRRRPKPGNDAETEVLGCGLEEGTEEEAAAPRPPQASPT